MTDPLVTFVCFYFAIGGVVYMLNSKPLTLDEAEKALSFEGMAKELFLWPAFIWPFKKHS